MLRLNDIQDSFLHLVGWEKGFNSDIIIAESLTKSESGLYFQGEHPLITLENMACIAPNFNVSYPEYDGSEEYSKGKIVQYAEKYYKALQPVEAGTEPGLEPTYWEETSPFSEWLEQKTRASIAKTVMRYYNDNLVKQTAKSLVENTTLFDGTGRLVNTIQNKGKLVGLEIVPIRAKGITTRINRVGLQFTAPGIYTLYLMHSSSYEPIRVLTCEKKKANTMEWFDFEDLYMPYQNSDIDAGGSWYLCYLQAELPEGSQAIYKDKDWSAGPCKGCNRSDFVAWQAWSKYLEINPFNLKLSGEEEEFHMWDIELNDYDYTKNYGLNLELTIECDLTDFLIDQRAIFADALGKQLVVDMLRELAYNPNVRTNRHSINASRADILFALDGDRGALRSTGLSEDLKQAYKALELNFTGVDRVCQPCRNNGLKYRTI